MPPDTQLPRFEVFEQERPGQPHRNAGSLHAPDLEMALLNARDVFVRRPACLSLWVVPAAAIYSRTAEQLAAPAAMAPSDNRPPAVAGGFTPPPPAQTYQVFTKPSQRQTETFVSHVGAVQAPSPDEALRLALSRFTEQPVFVWWVVPDSAILRSDPADAPTLFEPAAAKPYRSPNYYHVLTQMRAVRAESETAPAHASEATGAPLPTDPPTDQSTN